ncbi:replication protein (RepL) [Balnearium lithotrophicum]|uniref:Replication protein (RepL) n=1 Tax=Balnearium lithotrophicum TaxID=223788 RepID=A0A521ENG9_9BACT|nr:replication/maintenance protein RepL [Balnearium lithotrophicum]SMO85442.1 replication protein (RepL) [Balnearium lithotrophicum]
MALKLKGKNLRFKGLITEDGEVIPIELMFDAFIPRSPKDKEPYVKVYGEKVLDVIRSKKLKASELEVFMWFIGKSSNKNYWANEWITVDYGDLAKELNLSLITVKRAIKVLLKLKFIVQWKPRKTVFRLNPDYCFKGGAVSKQKVKEEELKRGVEEESVEEYLENTANNLIKQP